MNNNKKKILLVEDDPNFGSILKEYLKINGYHVTLAKNGIEGFEKFMMWLFSKFDKDAKEMMAMEPKPVETFLTKVEDDHVWVGIDMND